MSLEVGSAYAKVGFREDLTGAHRWEREYDRVERKAKQGAHAHLDAKADTSAMGRYNRGLQEVDRHHDRVVKSGGRLRTGFGQIWGAGGAAFAAAGGAYALVAGVKAVIGAYGESQKIGKQTETVLKSTGHAAHVSAKDVGDLATSLSRKTGVDDEAVQSGENLLLTFTNIRNEAGKGNDVFNQATKVSLDLSRALGMDLHGASIMVGKALNDPVKGVVALGRAGVQFSQGQKDTIKHLVDTGHHLEAQKIVLKELRTQVGGSAAAYGKTLPGALDKAKNELGNVAETIGKKLAPWLTKAAGFVEHLFIQFQKGKGPLAAAGRVIGDVARRVGAFVGKVVDAAAGGGRLGRIFGNVKTALGDVARSPIFGFFSRLIPTLVRFASKVLASKAGLVILHGAIGAVVGRAAALAAVWAVGRVVAFASAIGKGISALVGLRKGITLTSAAMKATPWGAIGTVIGLVAGALGLFSSGEHRAKTSADDLTDALHNQADALRGLRDSDLDAAQAHAALKSANVSLELAERRVNQLRKAGKLNTLEGRQAEADLAQARVSQKRATRDVGDIEANTSRKRSDATKATRDAITAAKGRIQTLKDELKGLKFIGAPTDMIKRKQKELNDTMKALPRLEGRLQTIGNSAENQRPHINNLKGTVYDLGGALRYIAAHNWVAHVGLSGVAQASQTLTDLAWRAAHIKIPHRRSGAKVGPGANRAIASAIYGEGGADEWWVSQEGDRRSNIGWAAEALQALTGRRVALGGTKKKGRSPAPWLDLNQHGAGRGAFERIWQAVRGLYPRAGSHWPGKLDTTNGPWVAWATPADGKPQRARDPRGEFLVPQVILDALAQNKIAGDGWGLDPSTIGKLLVHEMTHSQQAGKVLDSEWQAEGGAEAFARRHTAAVMARAGFSYKPLSNEGDPYNGFVRRVLEQLGPKWVDRLQFLARGGKAGPTQGGAAIVYGEGTKDEWFISQEGDRVRNIGWAVEALEKLTGRSVEFYRRGGRRSRTPHAPSPATIMGPGARKTIKKYEGTVLAYQHDLERLNREYGQMDRQFGFSVEDVVVQHDDGSVTIDEDAIAKRSGEIDQLIAKKGAIKDRMTKLQRDAKKLIPSYKLAVKNLNFRIAKHPKDSTHNAQVSTRDTIASRLNDLNGIMADLDLDLKDVDLDQEELNDEKKGLSGHGSEVKGPTDTGGGGGSVDTGGGGAGVDVPPSPLEIAQAAAAQLDTFKSGVQDALAAFGSNFARHGADPFAGAVAQLAGSSYFGAGGAGGGIFGGSGAAGAGMTVEGPLVEQHFGSPPPTHLWTDETVRKLNGAVG